MTQHWEDCPHVSLGWDSICFRLLGPLLGWQPPTAAPNQKGFFQAQPDVAATTMVWCQKVGWGKNTYSSPLGHHWSIQNAYNIDRPATGNISPSVNSLTIPFQRYLAEEKKVELMRTQWRRGAADKGSCWGPAVGTSQMKGRTSICHLVTCWLSVSANKLQSHESLSTLQDIVHPRETISW